MLPTFYTERLIIRPRVIDDLDNCLAMDRDPEVVRFINGPWLDRVKHREFVISRMNANYPTGLGYWTILKNDDTKKFLGWILLIPIDGHGPEVEIGWRLIRDAWGQGYASEAAMPILKYAFEVAGITKVVADIHIDNIGSRRVAEKIGLRIEEEYIHEDKHSQRYSLTQ